MNKTSIAVNVAVATIIYWLFVTVWDTGGLSVDALASSIFQAVAFALFYAAMLVGATLFKARKK